MVKIQELTKVYSSENIWNMDKSDCFCKALHGKGLVKKGKEAKGGEKSKESFTIGLF